MRIAVSEFKAKCLKLIDQLSQTRDPIVLTKRGKPVAKLVPADSEASDSALFGYMAGSATILGDIVSPVEQSWQGVGDDKDQLFTEFSASIGAERGKDRDEND